MTKSGQKMLRLMDRAVTAWHIPVIGKEKGRVLRRLLATHRCTRGLEIGSLFGYSAILIAGNMPRGGRFTCVENNPYLAKFCASNAERAGLKDRIKVVVGDALRVLPMLHGSVDFVLIDAKKEDYLDYLRAIEPRLVKGALIVADNTGIYRQDVTPYLAYVRAGGRYQSREYDFGFDCMEVSVFRGQGVMFGERHDPEFLKHLFNTTEILRKPITGIIAGYHVLPYILVGPQEEQPHRSVEIRGKIKVSPRLVLAPGRAGQTYGDLFKENELMDEALVARVFSFMYSSRHQVTLESEDLKIQRWDRNPQSQIERALDELAQRETINTGVILSPNVRFYPVSLDRFITEILDQEFRHQARGMPIRDEYLLRPLFKCALDANAIYYRLLDQ